MNSFESSGNIQKKEDGPDRSVSDIQSSSLTLNELTMKANIEFLCIEFKSVGSVLSNMAFSHNTREQGFTLSCDVMLGEGYETLRPSVTCYGARKHSFHHRTQGHSLCIEALQCSESYFVTSGATLSIRRLNHRRCDISFSDITRYLLQETAICHV